jgi:hypothetical protein
LPSAGAGVDRVVLCPTRWLHRVPVHALLTDPGEARRLLDTVEVVYAPSVAVPRRTVRETPLGASLVSQGVDLDAAFAQLEADQHSDDEDDDAIDFAAIQYWAPFRLCGLGSLDGE